MRGGALRLLGAAIAAAASAAAVVAGCDPVGSDLPALSRAVPSTSAGSGGAGVLLGAGGFVAGNEIPDPLAPCDADLDIAENDARQAARAVELCSDAKSAGFGVVSAQWTLVDGSGIGSAATNYDVGHGVLPRFGNELEPKAGARFLALSSGTARGPMDPGYEPVQGFEKGYDTQSPKGFPKPAPACPGVTTGDPHDGVALEVTLTAPPGAVGFAFDFNFFTYEWPKFICSAFNDYFVAILDPAPPGQVDGNVSFDSEGNPVSVNNAFLRACGCAAGPPCTAGNMVPKEFSCELGTSMLQGTGFEPGAATGWLTTTAPVVGGETVTLRWAVYDSGDGSLDSTTIVDGFRWLAGVDAGVGTTPEEPK